MLSELKISGDFNATGTRISIPGGSTNFPGKAVLASRVIPSGARVVLEKWSAKVIDLGNADQIYFVIARNGIALQSGLERIPGVQFDQQSQIDLDIILQSGLIEIIGYNISGMAQTIEPDAAAVAVAVSCQAWWNGKLLSERGGLF